MDKLLILAGILILCSLILPWRLWWRLNRLEDLVKTLQAELRNYAQPIIPTSTEATPAYPAPQENRQETLVEEVSYATASPWIANHAAHQEVQPAQLAPSFATPVKSKPSFSFEQQFGAKLPVWIGGIALAFAGFFLVKYSIEHNLLSPSLRVTFGSIFGFGLIMAATRVRQRATRSNGAAIAQSLSGAGIAVLYVCSYAAVSLYELVPPIVGMMGMTLVTALAITLSLLHGAPIALMGLIGGFLTPALVDSAHPSAPLLFFYLYGVFSALMIIIRRKRWWALSIPSLVGGFLWVTWWMTGNHFSANDTIWLGLFLLGVSATIILTSRQNAEEEITTATHWLTVSSALNYLGLGGALLLMGAVASKAGFGLMEWGIYGLLAIGGMALAWFREKLYGFLPLLAMSVNAVMFIAWNAPDFSTYGLTLFSFAMLYAVGGYRLMGRAQTPLLWAALTCSTVIGYYLIGWYKLHATPLPDAYPMGWGMLALLAAAAATCAMQESRRHFTGRMGMLVSTAFAITATTMLSLALTIEIPREFLSVAFALEMLALAWISSRIDLPALRYLSAALAIVFAFLLMPQIMLLIQLTLYSLVEMKLHLQRQIPLVDYPLFQLGLPALLFLGSARLLRLRQDGNLVRWMETACIALVGVMGYYLARHAFHVAEDVLFVKASFTERGVITNILFIYGLACMITGRWYRRDAFRFSGAVLCAIAMFRIVWFDLLTSNPLWNQHELPGVTLLNVMLLAYGLPLLWLTLLSREARTAGYAIFTKPLQALYLLLPFALLSLNVRYAFHEGTALHTGSTSEAELYTYSAVWLVMGITLLIGGVVKGSKTLRLAALGMMALVAGKVFLVDASDLEGLWRVASFFGLGVSLIGLSWFYTRFVVGAERD